MVELFSFCFLITCPNQQLLGLYSSLLGSCLKVTFIYSLAGTILILEGFLSHVGILMMQHQQICFCYALLLNFKETVVVLIKVGGVLECGCSCKKIGISTTRLCFDRPLLICLY